MLLRSSFRRCRRFAFGAYAPHDVRCSDGRQTCSAVVRVLVAGVLVAGLLPVNGYAHADVQDEAGAATEAASGTDASSMRDDSILVVYKDGVTAGNAGSLSVQSEEVAGISGATEEVVSEELGGEGHGAISQVTLPSDVSVEEAISVVQENPNVAYAQPVFKYRLLDAGASSGGTQSSPAFVPNDPILQDAKRSDVTPNQWWAKSVHAQEAWDMARCDNRVTIAVLDTGINFKHADLRSNILSDYAWDACEEKPLLKASTAVPTSAMDHGSHVAGIAAAEANNEFGIAGVSYNANILPICVFRERESLYGAEPLCDDADLIKAYDYLLSDDDGDGRTVAQETNTRVVNMSLGGYLADDPNYEYDYAFEDVIERAQDAGILTVAAGGNGDGYGNPRSDASYPSDYDAVVSVVALKSDTERAVWSDYSNAKDIAAPGVDIYSTWYYDDSFTFKSGTSMAAPVVSGVAALLWAYDPNLTVADVKRALYTTADDLGTKGRDPYYGWGKVNAQAALQSLGTASVSAERDAMVRTTTQRIEASSIADPASTHEWHWSVVDPDTGQASACASINDEGVLVARQAGVVEVRAVAEDDASLVGKRQIEIEDIAISGSVRTSVNPQVNAISLSWSSADAATGYRVLRSEEGDEGPFGEIAFVQATFDADGLQGYEDDTALPSVTYTYQVVPVGELDGARVDGIASEAVSRSYADKTALRASITEAEGVLAETKTSEDGLDVPSNETWSTPQAKSELGQALRNAYSAYYSGILSQDEVDSATSELRDAQQAFLLSCAVGLKEPERPAPKNDDPGTVDPEPSREADSVVMWRLYNPNSGEHFYTASTSERDSLVRAGWNNEGEGWLAPRESSVAVYRLYNPNAGDHHYTTSESERRCLVEAGWSNEGIGWFSDASNGVGLYRLYNPNAASGAHHYTVDSSERDNLARCGWQYEGIGWYGVSR